MEHFTFLHRTNIIIHVSAGTIALLLGIVILSLKKGGKRHSKMGRWFMILLSIVVTTGFIGVFVYGRNTFLILVTLLSGYQGFSGYRVLKAKSNKAKPLDIFVSLIALASVFYFVYYFKSIGMIWAPVIIYSTVGVLITLVLYDFLRYFIPESRYKKMWLYEHIYKMIGAFTALLAAFSGTVLVDFQPHSQFLPSIFGTILAINFVIYFYRKENVKGG